MGKNQVVDEVISSESTIPGAPFVPMVGGKPTAQRVKEPDICYAPGVEKMEGLTEEETFRIATLNLLHAVFGRPFHLDVPQDVALSQMFRSLAVTLSDAVTIMANKARGYGIRNIQVQGGRGVVGRIREKLARLENVFAQSPGTSTMTEESVGETALDVANLGLLLSLVVTNRYPGASWLPAATEQPAVLCSRCRCAV